MTNTIKNIFQTLPKKTIVLGILVLVLTILVLVSLITSAVQPQSPDSDSIPFFSPGPDGTIINSRSAEPVTPFQKTLISRTSEQQIASMSGLIDKQAGPGNSNIYNFESFLPQRPNQIIAQNGTVSFERTLTPINPNGPGFIKISDFEKTHGKAIQELKGSIFYGPFCVTYIYSTSGFAFVGNPNTDTIYEFQLFNPMSIENYTRLYGQDINTNVTIHQEAI